VKLPVVVLAVVFAFGAIAQEADPPAAEGADAPKSVLVEGGTLPPSTLPPVLDLDVAKRVALRENPGLAAAEARIRQAQARVRQAWSRYLPTVDANVSGANTWLSENDYRAARNAALAAPFQRFQSLVSGGTGGAAALTPEVIVQSVVEGIQGRRAVDNSFENYGAELFASWTLFDGFAREFALAAARYGRDETAAGYAEAQRLLLQAVAQSFFDIQLARENVAIAQADEMFNARQLQEAQARRRVGTGSLSDVLNFEVRVNAAREQLIRTRRDYAVSRIGLAELMALPHGMLPDGTDVAPLEEEPVAEMETPEATEWITYALEHRPDVARNRYTLKRQQANVGIQRSSYFPALNAFASHRADSTEGLDWSDEDFSTTVGVNVSYTLFAGGRNRAQVVEAKAQEREAQLLLNDLENAITADVRRALEGLDAALASLRLQRANAEFVRRNRELVEKEYAAGQGSLVRLNEAQRDLTNAEANLAQARVGVHRALHQFQTATGETLAEYFVEP
jgi:outer membrane protein TolC